MYKDDENEIDMETLSYLKNPAKVYVSVKPQIYNADGSASDETLRRQEVSFQPSEVIICLMFESILKLFVLTVFHLNKRVSMNTDLTGSRAKSNIS